MILITAGTVEIAFPRLIDIAQMLIYQTQKEQIILQAGCNEVQFRHSRLKTFKYISFPKMVNLYKSARYIIAASGEASSLLLLNYSKYKPLLFPRLAEHHEHVDNQQLSIAKNLTRRKLTLHATNSSAVLDFVRKEPTLNLMTGYLKSDKHSSVVNHLIREVPTI